MFHRAEGCTVPIPFIPPPSSRAGRAAPRFVSPGNPVANIYGRPRFREPRSRSRSLAQTAVLRRAFLTPQRASQPTHTHRSLDPDPRFDVHNAGRLDVDTLFLGNAVVDPMFFGLRCRPAHCVHLKIGKSRKSRVLQRSLNSYLIPPVGFSARKKSALPSRGRREEKVHE